MASSDADLRRILLASANASVHFALSCLAPVGGGARLRATSTFVDPQGTPMHWHDFGDLEGPGWAANAVGGALLLTRWGRYVGDDAICDRALRLVDHVLDDGFVRDDGFIWPYWDLAQGRFCLNYTHGDSWFCPGSLAKVGCQMLSLAAVLGATDRAGRLRAAAEGLGRWLSDHVAPLPNGWIARRVTPEGAPYLLTPEGGADPIFDHSADGLFLLDLWTRLGEVDAARAIGQAFVEGGGHWGSINHDTYDDHENVAYAVAFRVLRRAASALDRPDWASFAWDVALPAMADFRMARDEHGVVTRGLFWMERSWDTAYLWENAEVAQAHLEAWLEQGEAAARGAAAREVARDVALDNLLAMAHHHSGSLGFLSEGIDWNNHVSRRHHVDFDYYGAIRYTEPLLNNLHLVGPTLTYLQAQGRAGGGAGDRGRPLGLSCLDDDLSGRKPQRSLPADTGLGASLATLGSLSPVSQDASALEETEGRLWLRLYHPAIATDAGVAAAVAFCHDAGINGVLLFEASYDVDPAMLTLDELAGRFARLKAVVPVFREAGLAVQINVMITMGHVDQGGGRPGLFDFQFLVDAQGAVSASSVCPLDPGFLAYVSRLYSRAAACGADAVWVDDDVRFLWHDSQEMTCFCRHHLAAMAAQTGRDWTREALVAALSDAGADAAVRQAWFRVQAEAMAGLARTVEAAVHGVDADQQIGLMTVGTTVHNAEGRQTDSLLRILSGRDTGPMVRPGSGFWHDWEPAAVLAKTEDVVRQVAYLGRDVRVVAEIENHPYSPFQKSRRVLALEMALNILAGTHDLSLNIFPGTMAFREDTDMAAFLRAQTPFLRALRRVRAGKRRVGVGIEGREDVPSRLPPAGGALMGWVEPRPWEIALARMGIPVGTLTDAPHLLAGSVVYTDRYAIGSALQDGTLLTPDAVRGLLDQGWGPALGIEAVASPSAAVNEVVTGDALNGDHAGVCLPVRHYAEQLRPHTWVFRNCAKPRALSRWRGLDGTDRGPATVALVLPNGRRIGLLPFEIDGVAPALLQPARRDQWAGLLAWVADRPLPVRVVGGVNVAPQVFVGRDGEVMIALVNLSADDRVAQLDAPVLADAGQVERLTRDGTWVPVDDATRVPVAAWSVTVLRATGVCR